MRGRCVRAGFPALAVSMLVLIAASPPAGAVHEGTNDLVFAPVTAAASVGGSGEGTIDYRGGGPAESRWTATFRFGGLAPNRAYTVVVRGQFGEDGSAEADAFTEICAFTTDAAGDGGCWYYLVVLIRLAVVQVRLDGVAGVPVLQATRDPAGPGLIAGAPNRFSPPTPPATPELPATPAATPRAAGQIRIARRGLL